MNASPFGAAVQLQDYAFTVGGVAYRLDDCLKQRPTPMLVTASSPSSTSWTARLEEVGSDKAPTNFSRPEEQGNPGYGQARYVVVGVVPFSLPSDQELGATKSRHGVGTSITPTTKVRSPVPGKLPLRVVAPITNEHPKGGLKLYALTDMNPTTRLCNAHIIGQDVVFYFAEYRTGATNISNRRREWNERIMVRSVIGQEDRPYWGTGISVPPSPVCSREESFANELRILTSSLDMIPSAEGIKQVEGLLAKATGGQTIILRSENRPNSKSSILALIRWAFISEPRPPLWLHVSEIWQISIGRECPS
ncbi:hypothetical protein BO78DRAFT_382006 [Aspergillus sclerotiicarbonarius CBS 121057]|uniref:Uncharacterized protein n=1 Tax=Aspergillus sclerotiicarbonarius (strain CBS 121057 / IBT 28362) TaxID=1448318 RepID=A0A319ENQ8_ASPSB|nr:hypothetical protein BO78DRAFT_382006 [Aspergillus sclerotiicarbonarius CBS 121057]